MSRRGGPFIREEQLHDDFRRKVRTLEFQATVGYWMGIFGLTLAVAAFLMHFGP
jgi:hypothetical protein